MRVLGVDGGIANLGWAIVDHGRVEAMGLLALGRDPELDISACRARRGGLGAELMASLVGQYRIDEIAMEAGSYNPRRFSAGLGLALSIGTVSAVAALTGCRLTEAPPKRWQHAITGSDAKIDYQAVAQAMVRYLGDSPALPMLMEIAPTSREHPIDAAGVGIFATIRPDEMTVIIDR